MLAEGTCELAPLLLLPRRPIEERPTRPIWQAKAIRITMLHIAINRNVMLRWPKLEINSEMALLSRDRLLIELVGAVLTVAELADEEFIISSAVFSLLIGSDVVYYDVY